MEKNNEISYVMDFDILKNLPSGDKTIAFLAGSLINTFDNFLLSEKSRQYKEDMYKQVEALRIQIEDEGNSAAANPDFCKRKNYYDQLEAEWKAKALLREHFYTDFKTRFPSMKLAGEVKASKAVEGLTEIEKLLKAK